MQRLATFRWLVVSLMVGWLAITPLIGCQQQNSLEELIAQAALLEGVRTSGHSRLREEFRAVELADGLPAKFNHPPLAKNKNAARGLEGLLKPKEVVRVDAECAGLLAMLEIDPSAESIAAEATALAAKHQATIAEIVKLADRPECDFGIDYTKGRFGDFRFLNRGRMAVRLMLVDTIAQQEISLTDGIDRFARGWRWIDWLMEQRYLEAWLTAAELRLESLGVLERLVADSRATPVELDRLRKIVEGSFATWPSIEGALQRERAIDLHTYEAIRLGLVEPLFTVQERAELRLEGVLEDLCTMPPERIDADQAAYLATMRKLIELVRQPYYLIRDQLAEEDRQLGVHTNKQEYAWFANRLCTENLTIAIAELASDRARVEGWVVALTEATGNGPAAVKLNPVNGQPYQIERIEGHIVVRLEDRRLANPLVRLPTP